MNTIKNSLLVAVLTVSTLSLLADDSGAGPESRGPRGPRGGGRGVPPIVAAIDTNRDGILDATEVGNSAAALGALDTNNDGVLTRDELMLKGGRGPGRPDGASEGRPGPGRPPFVGGLDANEDGTLDATEIANAPTILAALDRNADGSVTRDEMRPEGGRGPGRPEGAPEDRPEGGRPGKRGPGGRPGPRPTPPAE